MFKFNATVAALAAMLTLPAALGAHEGKATAIMTEMANFHASFVNTPAARIDTTKLVRLLRAGGDSKTEKEIFTSALPLAEKLGDASSLAERLALYAQLVDRVAPLHGFHDESGTYVFYCPMVKKKWIARGDTVSNPYGPEMRSCGSRQ